MCKKSLVSGGQTVIACWSPSRSILGRSTSWVGLGWKCSPTLICPSYSINPIRMFYKCFVSGGQTVTACLYCNLFIQESENISETVEKCWPTYLFRNMVIKKKKACTNLTYTGYILDNNICQQVDIVCLPLQSVLGSAT